MIHTFKIISDLEAEHVIYMKENHGIETYELCGDLGSSFKGVEVCVVQQPYTNKFLASIFVDVPVMLNRGEITEADLPIITRKLEYVFGSFFGDKNLFHQHRLMRMDYRYDVVVESKEHRDAYIDLFEKSLRKKGHRQRKLGLINVKGKFVEYGTTIEHKNKSIKSMIYDKMTERIIKGEKVELYEKNVLRFEVSLEKDRLYYETKSKGLVRSLDNYFSCWSFVYYMKIYILETYLTQDFYRYANAIEMINESHLTLQRKKSLESFIRKVTRGDLSSPQEVMAPSTFRNKLKDFEEVGVHPITIPNRWKHVPDVFLNPLSPLNSEVSNYL